jgi:hypothetical protein
MTPTAVGARLELAPWEVPTDRVIELTRQLDALNVLNRSLIARIQDMEAGGATREQALAEAGREVETSEIELAKARGSLQLTREEVALLRVKLQQMEAEDVETLKMVIAALDKLYNAPPRREP